MLALPAATFPGLSVKETVIDVDENGKYSSHIYLSTTALCYHKK